MKRLISAGSALALVLLFATMIFAQGNTKVHGQIFDILGKPWGDVTVVLTSEMGQSFTTKTNAKGEFKQNLAKGGVYEIHLINQKANLDFKDKYQVMDGQDTAIDINFKDLVEKAKSGQAKDTEAAQKAAEQANAQANAFKNMKAHFDAGVAAMTDSAQVRQQLAAAPADQKGALQDKVKADGQTAITEFKAAEQGVGTKDVKNHALVLANLGQAYDTVGDYTNAADSYQKAIDLQPAPPYYVSLGTALAKLAAAQTDPSATQQKVADATAACDKASTLDPATAGTCYKNVGIVLNNKGDLKDAIGPLQKAAQANPKDAQAWFLLGSAYTGTIDTKQEGDKVIYIIPPGTAEAYQKAIDADPNGPYAPQAKAALDNIAQLSGGVQTQVGTDNSNTKKKKR
ncbi:MAG TPA: tetratricopeptide repeat protein [Candidatus Acidoferrales bacterium]|nr:tetratricopeptide repeat protein [Candidatus Acidoferrales bacterium]